MSNTSVFTEEEQKLIDEGLSLLQDRGYEGYEEEDEEELIYEGMREMGDKMDSYLFHNEETDEEEVDEERFLSLYHSIMSKL